jgi:hypothetical protein
MFSCKKEMNPIYPPSPQAPDPKSQVVLLKDILEDRLPSPYYHFEYNTDSTISVVSFASDFTRYQVGYDAGRISELTNANLAGSEKVQYFYDNTGKVITVNYLDLAGAVYVKVFFTYDGKKLSKLERQRKLDSDFVVNKIMSFDYYADGNVKNIIDHRPAVPGRQDESTSIQQFEQYDNKINVDGFGLIHNDFFDHLVLLPGVVFQKNNPGKEIFTSVGLNYEANYTYTYNDKSLPLIKVGDVIFTAGPNAGQRFQANTTYSYY